MQEGSDNIDINADTVDEKNTFHSLARVEAPRVQMSLTKLNHVTTENVLR